MNDIVDITANFEVKLHKPLYLVSDEQHFKVC